LFAFTIVQTPLITWEDIYKLCRGYDYWWSITDDTVKEYTTEEYYIRFLHADIIKAAEHLNDPACQKESVYTAAP